MTPDISTAFLSFAQSSGADFLMPRNGRTISSAELDAHLSPIREDIRRLVDDQRAFAEFMTGAISSRSIQEGVRKSRHFWMGFGLSMSSVAIGTMTLLLRLHG